MFDVSLPAGADGLVHAIEETTTKISAGFVNRREAAVAMHQLRLHNYDSDSSGTCIHRFALKNFPAAFVVHILTKACFSLADRGDFRRKGDFGL